MSIFETFDAAVSVLNNTSADVGQLNRALPNGLRDLDAEVRNSTRRRGAWLQRLDNVETRVGGQKLLAQEERSNAEDLDMVHAFSDFPLKQTGYDGAVLRAGRRQTTRLSRLRSDTTESLVP